MLKSVLKSKHAANIPTDGVIRVRSRILVNFWTLEHHEKTHLEKAPLWMSSIRQNEPNQQKMYPVCCTCSICRQPKTHKILLLSGKWLPEGKYKKYAFIWSTNTHIHVCGMSGGKGKVNSESLEAIPQKIYTHVFRHFVHRPSSVQMNQVSKEIYKKISTEIPPISASSLYGSRR